jgi:hypothetical protein
VIIPNPRYVSHIVSDDVVSNICQTLAPGIRTEGGTQIEAGTSTSRILTEAETPSAPARGRAGLRLLATCVTPS